MRYPKCLYKVYLQKNGYSGYIILLYMPEPIGFTAFL